MVSICFATNNKNKLAEVRSKIGDQFTILSLEDIGCMEELPETQPTIEGNSEQKAQYVAQKYKVNCFADDTGLLVDALNGAPGVYSARYAGPECSPEDNMNKLLAALEGIKNREAYFKTCVTLVLNNQQFQFSGAVNGTILTERHGEKGFGYDPIFQPNGYTTSFAEMSMEEKNTMSHRALAVAKLFDYLKSAGK
ncbi:non-canonical purine NTP diphosphatase [Cytophaga hutchinsonii]|uniref:dITP/XTP pyrophosphatase n=1 Tax=Cytophaga hutchinsonii (strain ATCC 33406 / DSM 1761 / CIP 103989 / NBRC 15051 / NCIMB 9469 / D465) TaxID=269798 RepID=A0A6N4SMC6_CYTH3|nr:non-canonical purine NTP diphosphatase [Cytophaga hutchinsonii]ABG57409.1 xanthosine triphosphate pyrophosphatase, Ham1-like protein [Cytophaga hutchinsonii ATCC 33406]SFX97636.1 XTP/dITP diphosphohydrolase [Cytophaga hutchinsonii ATCC 33406]